MTSAYAELARLSAANPTLRARLRQDGTVEWSDLDRQAARAGLSQSQGGERR
jgi:hypothetical protein